MDVVAIGSINVLSCHGDKFVKNEKGKNDSIPHSIWANGIFFFFFLVRDRFMGNEIHIHQFVYISMVDCINIIHLIWSICVIRVIHNTSHMSPLSSILILKSNLIHVAKVHPCNFISSISF
jgi:hypothetical protein